MIDNFIFLLTFLSALGCGLMAGVFFIFSNTVMNALSRLKASQGISAMQSINYVILNPLFFIVFFGTGVISILLSISIVWSWNQMSSVLILIASVIYLVGAILVTVVFNVPMNESLKSIEPGSTKAVDLWTGYLTNWTTWNHIRTVAAFLGAISFMLALS